MSHTGVHIDVNAPAILRTWPSLNSERTSASVGAPASSGRRPVAGRVHPAVPVRHAALPHRDSHRAANCCAPDARFHRRPTLLFWLLAMDVMVFCPRSDVRGTRGKGCREESKASRKTRRRSRLRIRFCGVKRFLSLHKSFAKLAQGNPARLGSSDFSVAGAGLRKLLGLRRISL
jgi:hypothetical protein